MFPLHQWPIRLLAVAATALALSVPCAAFEKYLPDKTELVVAINLRQVLDAPPVKKYAPGLMKEYWLRFLLWSNKDNEGLRKLIEDNPGVFQKDVAKSPEFLATLGEHVSTFVVAGLLDGGDDEFLAVVQGRFDAGKAKKLVQWAGDTKFLGLSLKTQKVSGRDLYEFSFPKSDGAIFLALADEQHVLFSLSKDWVVEALAKTAGNRKPKLNKGLQALLDKVDRKQSLWLIGYPPKDDEVEGVTAGVRIAADVQMEMTVAAKSAEAARKLTQEAKDELPELGEQLKKLAEDQKELAPFVPLLQKVEVTLQGTAVRLRGQIPAAVLEQVLKSLAKER
jgi:hypothetical protein